MGFYQQRYVGGGDLSWCELCVWVRVCAGIENEDNLFPQYSRFRAGDILRLDGSFTFYSNVFCVTNLNDIKRFLRRIRYHHHGYLRISFSLSIPLWLPWWCWFNFCVLFENYRRKINMTIFWFSFSLSPFAGCGEQDVKRRKRNLRRFVFQLITCKCVFCCCLQRAPWFWVWKKLSLILKGFFFLCVVWWKLQSRLGRRENTFKWKLGASCNLRNVYAVKNSPRHRPRQDSRELHYF